MNTPLNFGPEKSTSPTQLNSPSGLEYYNPTPGQVTSGKLPFRMANVNCSEPAKTTQTPSSDAERHAIEGEICKSCKAPAL